jgi:hypothetical protein
LADDKTLEVRLSRDHVRRIGGDKAWNEALGLANAKAINEGLGQLVSQNYQDAKAAIDTNSDEYVITFSLR